MPLITNKSFQTNSNFRVFAIIVTIGIIANVIAQICGGNDKWGE